MYFNVKISLILGVVSTFAAANAIAFNSSSYFTGLLNDVLQTNRENELEISPLCDIELNSIRNGLDERDIWAIKCECFVD